MRPIPRPAKLIRMKYMISCDQLSTNSLRTLKFIFILSLPLAMDVINVSDITRDPSGNPMTKEWLCGALGLLPESAKPGDAAQPELKGWAADANSAVCGELGGRDHTYHPGCACLPSFSHLPTRARSIPHYCCHVQVRILSVAGFRYRRRARKTGRRKRRFHYF